MWILRKISNSIDLRTEGTLESSQAKARMSELVVDDKQLSMDTAMLWWKLDADWLLRGLDG